MDKLTPLISLYSSANVNERQQIKTILNDTTATLPTGSTEIEISFKDFFDNLSSEDKTIVKSLIEVYGDELVTNDTTGIVNIYVASFLEKLKNTKIAKTAVEKFTKLNENFTKRNEIFNNKFYIFLAVLLLFTLFFVNGYITFGISFVLSYLIFVNFKKL